LIVLPLNQIRGLTTAIVAVTILFPFVLQSRLLILLVGLIATIASRGFEFLDSVVSAI
jgi:hypothetical protein